MRPCQVLFTGDSRALVYHIFALLLAVSDVEYAVAAAELSKRRLAHAFNAGGSCD